MASSRQQRPPKIVSSSNDNRSNKSLISLEAWESQTTLDAEQTASVAALRAACEKKPLPLKVSKSVQEYKVKVDSKNSFKLITRQELLEHLRQPLAALGLTSPPPYPVQAPPPKIQKLQLVPVHYTGSIQ